MDGELALSLNATLGPTDSEEFARKVVGLIRAVILTTSPAQVYVIKVDNWFGPRWLAFSHKEIGAFGVASYDLVVPPFVPNRIEAEVLLARGPSGSYEESTPPQPIHIEQVSGENATRKLSSLFSDAAFFWWSGKSAINGRGSLMAYLPNPEGHVPWYLGSSADNAWSVSLLRGISLSELRIFGVRASEDGTS